MRGFQIRKPEELDEGFEIDTSTAQKWAETWWKKFKARMASPYDGWVWDIHPDLPWGDFGAIKQTEVEKIVRSFDDYDDVAFRFREEYGYNIL